MKKMLEEISEEITKSYEEGTTIPEAERLATKLLSAMLMLTEELKRASLDARMKKSGVKAIRAAAYLDEVARHDKKPSDSMLDNTVNASETVQDEQKKLDEAEVEYEYLENYMSIFREAHIHFRSIAKGKFE